jgi:hypothetical protein
LGSYPNFSGIPQQLRITNESGRMLVANQVIRANWVPNTYYRSIIQY